MPMLNEERYIGPCLDSILSQQFDLSRVEILVVDGGSTDRSVELVRRYAERNSRICLLHNPHRYQAQALNIALPHVRGQYVLRMDCHSRYPPDYIASVVEAFERTGADNISGPNITQPGADTTQAMAIFLVQSSRLGGGASFGRQEGGEGRFLVAQHERTSGWSFTRAILEKTGPFDERLVRNQDNEYSCRLRRHGGRVYFEPRARSYYFSRSSLRRFVPLMFRNGFYHMLTWRVSPGSFSWTHCVPAAFVAALVVLGAAAAVAWPARWALGAMLCAYAVAVLAASAAAAIRHGGRFLLWLPWMFPLTHIAYGIGTWCGIFRFGFVRLEDSDSARRVDTGAPPRAAGRSAAADMNSHPD